MMFVQTDGKKGTYWQYGKQIVSKTLMFQFKRSLHIFKMPLF